MKPQHIRIKGEMKLSWIGIALLASSWIFSLNYFYHYHWTVWALMIIAGALCLHNVVEDIADRKSQIVSLLLLVPCIFFAQWPYRVIPLLLIIGLLLLILIPQYKESGHVGTGFITAGGIMVVQALILQIYMNITSRSHELPYFLSKGLEWVVTMLGMDASAAGSDLALFSMRKIHRIGVTWELLLDPATLSFLVGGLIFVIIKFFELPEKLRDIKKLISHLFSFAAPFIIWLPLRAGLLLSVYIHRVLLTDYDSPLNQASQFWNPWLNAALLIIPLLLSIRFVNISANENLPLTQKGSAPVENGKSRWRCAVVSFFAGCLALTLALYWVPQGKRKPGRILVDDYHSKAPWIGKDFDTTRTDKAYDTEWYGHASSYNYASIYDYCTWFYEMSRLYTDINDEILHNADVLVLKVPSASYSDAEVASVCRFVENGGGLLLMGEHTNVFGSGVNLNRIAKTFGFKFRYDCLFGIDSVFKQRYFQPQIPHPIIRNMPLLDFAVSCSIDPGLSSGQAVIRAAGLKNLGSDYHASNFYPQAEDEPEMRYGAFVQLWATRHGHGRVAAFTDSTIFSNFSAFEPGKSELMLGMLEWLNHQNSPVFLNILLAVIGSILLIVGLILIGLKKETCVIIIAAGMLGWVVAGFCINSLGMELPEAERLMVRVALERGISGASLPEGGFISGEEDCFGHFERCILRLGYFPYRSDSKKVFDGNLLIILYPSQKPSPGFIKELEEYVKSGGKALILDSVENKGSATNDLLQPFALSVKGTEALNGILEVPQDLPEIMVTNALEVIGGDTVASLFNKPVAANLNYGKGSLTIIGFGSRFSDFNMGVIGDVIPDTELRKVYDFLYIILRKMVESK
jgi:hypothetical protein